MSKERAALRINRVRCVSFLLLVLTVVSIPFFVLWGLTGVAVSTAVCVLAAVFLRVTALTSIRRTLGVERLRRAESPVVFAILDDLTRQLGSTRRPRIYTIRCGQVKLGLFGLSSRTASIVLSDGLCANLKRDQLELCLRTAFHELLFGSVHARTWAAVINSVLLPMSKPQTKQRMTIGYLTRQMLASLSSQFLVPQSLAATRQKQHPDLAQAWSSMESEIAAFNVRQPDPVAKALGCLFYLTDSSMHPQQIGGLAKTFDANCTLLESRA